MAKALDSMDDLPRVLACAAESCKLASSKESTYQQATRQGSDSSQVAQAQRKSTAAVADSGLKASHVPYLLKTLRCAGGSVETVRLAYADILAGRKPYDLQGAAFIALRAMKDAAVTPELIKTLGSPHSAPELREERAVAGMLLGEMQDSSCVPGLIEVLKQPYAEAEAKSCAARLIGQMADSSALSPLREILDDPRWSADGTDFKAAYALAMLGDASAIPKIDKTLSNSKIPIGLRGWLTLALANIDSDMATSVLSAALGTHLDAAAIEALLKSGRNLDPLVDVLKNGAKEETERCSLARELGPRVNDPSVGPAFLTLSADSTQPERLRMFVIDSLWRMRDASATEVLIHVLEDSTAPIQVRKTADYTLHARNDPSAFPAQIRFWSNVNQETSVLKLWS